MADFKIMRNGLNTEIVGDPHIGQSSEDITVAVTDDGTYTGYEKKLYYSYGYRNQIYRAIADENASNEFVIPMTAFLEPGIVKLSLELSNGTNKPTCNACFIIATDGAKSVAASDILPDEETWQSYIQSYLKSDIVHKPTVDALEKRIDNLILSSGSDSSAEVIDIRIGADGTKYSTAGDAVRGQVSKLNNELDELDCAVFNVKTGADLTWMVGGIDKVSGKPASSTTTTRIRTSRFFSKGGSVKPSNGYMMSVAVYNSDSWDGFEKYVDFSASEYQFESDKYYVIIVKDDVDTTFDQSSIGGVVNHINVKFWNDDGKVANVSDEVKSIKNSVDALRNVGLASNIIFSVGGLNSDGSVNDNTERLHSDVIFVLRGSKIRLKKNQKLKFAVYKYSDQFGNEFISSTALSLNDYIFTEDCYIRILVESGDTNRLKDINFDLFSFDLNELNNRVKYTELTEWVDKGYIPISEVNDYTKFAITKTAEWSFMVLPVRGGDKFIIHGYGGNNSKLYAFTDRFGKVLTRAEKANVMQKLVITSPADGYVIFNILQSKEHQVIKFNTNVINENNKRNLIIPPYMPSAYNPISSVPNSKTTAMTYEEIVESWDNLQKKYPNYISKTNLGKETSGTLDMYRYDFIPEIVPLESSVLDGMNKIYTKNDYPIVIMGACVHGAERPCAKALLNLMTLIANAKDYSILGWLRNNIHFVIIPLENPWGYKNDKRTNVNKVDLNRNFEPFWEKGDDTTENQRYRGTAPLSEKETQYIDSILKECADKAVCYYSFHTHGVFTSYSMMTNFSSPAMFLLNDMQNIGMSVTKMITTSGWTNHNLPEDSGYIGCMEMEYEVAMASYQGAKYNIPSACPEVMYRYYDGGTSEVYNTDVDCMNTEYILYAVANACKKFLYGY